MPDPKLMEWGWALGLSDDDVMEIEDWDRLFTALAARMAAIGPDTALAGFYRGVFHNPAVLDAIAAGTPESIEIPDEVFHTQTTAVTRAMLAELLPDRFAPLELTVGHRRKVRDGDDARELLRDWEASGQLRFTHRGGARARVHGSGGGSPRGLQRGAGAPRRRARDRPCVRRAAR